MTLNFVDIDTLEESIEELTYPHNFVELYFTGNPCMKWEGYRPYVVAKLEKLRRLDGEDVTRSERLAAK
jgi:protein TilB